MPARFPARVTAVCAASVALAGPLLAAPGAGALEWSAPTAISPGAVADAEAVAVGPDGAATVFYSADVSGVIRLMAASRPAEGAGWTTQQVSTDRIDPGDVVDAVAAPDGSVTVAWVDADANTARAATRPAGDSTFGDPATLGSTTEHLALAVNDAGDTVLAATTPGFASLWAARRPAGAAWSAPETVVSGSTNLGWPTLIADRSGAFHLAVARNSPSGILALRVAPGADSWDLAILDSGAIESEANVVDMVAEANGDVTAIWQRDVAPGKGFDPLLAATRDAATGSWSTPVDPTGANATGVLPSLVALPDGHAEAYWTGNGFGAGAGVRVAGAWSASSFPAQGYAMVAYPQAVANATGGSTVLAVAAAGMGPPIDVIARTAGENQVLAADVVISSGPPPVAANRFGAITAAWVSTADHRVYARETPGDYTPATPPPPPPATPAPEAPPEPEQPPAAVLSPLAEALLSGKTIRINALVALRAKKRCRGTSTAQVKVGKRTVRATLKLKSTKGACRATGTIKLKAAPAKGAKPRVKVSGRQITARTLTVTRAV